jgi:serine/threonine-protein kinase
MYEAACGKLPFDGDDAVSVALKQVNEQPVPPSQVNPNVDDSLEAIILRCMDKNPARRFQTADELRGVLNNYIAGRPLGIAGSYAGGATARVGANGQATKIMHPAVGGGATGTRRMPQAERGTSPYVAAGGGAQAGRAGGSSQQPRRGISAGAVAGGVAVAAVVVVIVAAVLSLASCGGSADQQNGTTDVDTTTTSATTSAATATVPSVTGLTAQEAKNKLESYGFKLGSTTYDTSDDVTVNKIISQSPASGEEAEEGSRVDVVISSGSTKVTIESLLGKSAEEAENIIEAAGLVAVHDESLDGYSDTYDTGLVITYTPANQQLSKGATVSYGLSTGRTTTVPYGLEGMSEADASAAIEAAGLTVYRQYVYSDTVAEGYVAYITDTPGRVVPRGEYINIYVSQGVAPVTLQDYTGWSATTAQNDLVGRGLSVTIQYGQDAASADQAGLVYATSPSSGQEVATGGSVTIYAYGSYTAPTTGEGAADAPSAASEE